MMSRSEIFNAVSLIGLVLAAGVGVHGADKMEKAIFAGGCFWCMVHPFDELNGVVSVRAGYTGGTGADPKYDDYAGKGHLEAVEITYEPSKISYTRLLDVLWRQIDPTDRGGQFVDRGPQYRSAIFYTTPEQKKLAEESKAALNSSGRYDKPVVTEIIKAGLFYEAEAYHQDYYKKNPLKYKFYRLNSGRDRYLKKIWGKEPSAPYDPPSVSKYRKPSKDELKKMLTPMQYHVTQQGGTEPAFHNEYWENHEEGIYVDVVSGEPLFSSADKFDSGTGWPSFTKPLEPGNVVRKEHKGIFGKRIEVRSRLADSHLGDLFYDGPPPTGIRYCLDSAALRFVPRAELADKGYGQYRHLFEKEKAGVR